MTKQQDKLYYAQKCSITIQLERLNPEFDGLQQLADAIRRTIRGWDDVWGNFRIQLSDSRTPTDWADTSVSRSPSQVVNKLIAQIR